MPRAVRFKVPDGRTTFADLVHGRSRSTTPTSKTSSSCARTASRPITCRWSCDDIDMAITHVIRGDDHISNTPKHVLLFEAFGAPMPLFAHVPLILGPDKKRLSKRHGATSVMEYRGWATCPRRWSTSSRCSAGRRAATTSSSRATELVTRFALEGISGGNAVFNPEKLDWFNQQHIMRLPAGELRTRGRAAAPRRGSVERRLRRRRAAWLERVIELLKPRAKTLGSSSTTAAVLRRGRGVRSGGGRRRSCSRPACREHLAALRRRSTPLPAFDAAAARGGACARWRTRAASSRRCSIHATRVAVTGKAASPGLFEVLSFSGATAHHPADRRLHLSLASE